MKAINTLVMAGVLALGMNGGAMAADLNSAVAYSMGEFDRVGVNQPAPKTESGKAQKTASTKLAATGNNREMNAQKAEFVRRMFWMALSMR